MGSNPIFRSIFWIQKSPRNLFGGFCFAHALPITLKSALAALLPLQLPRFGELLPDAGLG